MTRVIFGCGYLPDPIQACFGERALGLELEYVVEPRPMGTAGGIRHAARGRVSETFLALNGDILADAPLADLVAAAPRARRGRDDRAHARGRSRAATASCAPTPSGRVLGFLEKPEPEEIDTDLINAGAYVLEPAVLDLIEDGRPVSIERETFPSLVGDGAVRARAERLLVRRRHARELHRRPPRPAGRAHPLAAARARWSMRAGSTRARRLAGRRARVALPGRGRSDGGGGRARRRRQLAWRPTRRSRRARSCAAPSCRSARGWGRARSSRTP